MPILDHAKIPGRGRFRLVVTLLVFALGVFLLTRGALLAWSWRDLDAPAGAVARIFGYGALYDLAFYAYAAVPVVLYLLFVPQRWWARRANRWLVRVAVFATVYGLGFIAVAELIFWGEFRARFNFIAVDYLVYLHEASVNIYESYPVVSILLGLVALAALVYRGLAPALERALGSHGRLRARLAPAAAWLALPLVAFAGIGQDLRQFGADSYASELAGNGPYQFIAAFRNNELDYQAFYASLPRDEASALLRRELATRDADFLDARPYAVNRAVHAAGRERRLNVVLVTVESLGADFLARFGNREGITPNLDRLVAESLFFSNFYATGTRTVRGLEAVTLSIPPTPGHAIVKRIGRESGMWSLGNVLRAKGYDVRFLYGGRGYFDNMNAFFSGNGYAVVDQSSVPEEEIRFKNAWGMADEDLYTQALKNADDAHAHGAPFFFHVMTTSNHRPFTYPDGRIDLPSGRAGRSGAVKYTDWAIGELLAQARRRAWFEDTVFVILADHCASSAGRMALPLERYHIPMWVYSPRHVRAREVATVASQIDVAPTVLALLNMSYASSAFGRDVLAMAPGEGRALIGNHVHLGYYRPGQLWMLSPQRRSLAQLTPESAHPRVVRVGTEDPGLRTAIAYYQGAANVYQRQLNAWAPPPEPLRLARNQQGMPE